jgi:hypothetical protein
VFDPQADQIVAAEGAPEAEQQQCAIAERLHLAGPVAFHARLRCGGAAECIDALKIRDLKRRRLLLDRGMQRANALEGLAHDLITGRVWKALTTMPACQCGQALPQGVVRQ